MNTDRLITRTKRWTTAAALLLLAAGTSHAFTPDAPINLFLSSGPTAGSVTFQWDAQTDGSGISTAPAGRYEIRYRFNVAINNEADWQNSTSIDQPPLNLEQPSASAPQTRESLTVNGLEPGVTYAFAIKAINADAAATRSVVAGGVTANATSSCGKDPNDGLSVAALTASPVNFKAGQKQVFNIGFSVSGPGLLPGGKIGIRVPDAWPQPSTTTLSTNPGYVQVTTLPGGMQVSIDGQTIVFSATSTVASGPVAIKYTGFSCEAGDTRKFVATSQYSDCGVMYPTGQEQSVTVAAGDAEFVDFDGYDLTFVTGNINRVGLRVTDRCRNTVVSTVNVNVTVKAIYQTAANVAADPLAALSLSSSMSSPSTIISPVVLSNSTGTAVYYKITSSANKPNNYIQIQHLDIQTSQALIWQANVHPVDTGITGASVDLGSAANAGTSVTFTPDGDNSGDIAYINYSVPDAIQSKVEISSDNFNTIIRRFFNNTASVRIGWDGFMGGTPGAPPSIAPPATYAARISFGNGTVTDTSLSIVLNAAGVIGTVKDDASNPLSNVDVQIFGVSGRYARTDPNGGFTAYGLKPGDYHIRVQKPGYSTVENVYTIPSGVTTLPLITMTKQSILRLYVTRPTSTDLPEIWGQVRTNTSDWSHQEFGTVHFARGKTTSDAGDTYNVVATSYTSVTFAPGLQYRIHFDIPNLKVADSTATLNANEIRDMPMSLLRSANLTGNVALPAGAVNNANGGTWISIEVGPDANLDGLYDNQDPTKRYYGGVWIQSTENTGRYNVFGVENGSYTVTATAPGFAPQKLQVVVSNAVDAVLNFSTFSVGGVIYGTVEISGDTTGLAGPDGKIHVPVNAYSASQQLGSFQDVRLTTGAAGSSSSFSITGLSDGVYDINSNLPGYELIPAGRKTATVSSSSGTVDLSFQPYSGSLVGDISLGGNSDYSNVAISLIPFDFNQPRVDISPSTSHYNQGGLGTGYFQLHAVYKTTGYTIDRNIQLVNNNSVRADLDLSGNTFQITGHVTTSARAPYNDLAYFLSANAAPTKLITGGNGIAAVNGSTTVPANRIAVQRLTGDNSTPNKQGNALSFVDLSKTFFAYYDSSGTFTIPKLTPGSYRLRTNGELNNNFNDGPEVSQATAVIQVATASATGVVLNIIDGYDITGSIRTTAADIPTGRRASLRLKDSAGNIVAEQQADLSAAAVSFTISRIPNGDYLLSVEDDQYPKAFSAKDTRVKVDGKNPDSISIDLLNPARIIGKLRIKTSGTLLTSRNFDQFLSTNFSAEARANPSYSGGYFRENDPFIDADGIFTIAANPGRFDVVFSAFQPLSALEISQGKKQFVPLTISGIQVAAGQTFDLGVVDLVEGSTLGGTIKDRAGNLLANIPVMAYASQNKNNGDSIVAFTNEKGQYQLQGIDVDKARFYDVIAAPRSSNGDSRLTNFDGPRYGEVRRTQVDTKANPSVDFVLDRALGSAKGRVVTPDGGALVVPFNKSNSQPGAHLIMNKVGEIPQNNPLGNIEADTNPDGTFEVKGLTPGTYSLWALASGYGSGFLKNISVANTATDVGTVTLQAGQKLYGSLSTADGGTPNDSQIDVIVAVRNGFEEILIGDFTKDAAGNITDYSISGFQQDKAYTVLVFNKTNDITVLADNLVVNSLTRRDFTLTSRSPSILTQYSRAADGSVTIQYDFTRALRNSVTDLDGNGIPDDSDPQKIIRVVSGATTTVTGLTYATDWLTSDRRRARVTYTPANGEKSFTLRVAAVFEELNTANGANYATTSDFKYFLGIGKQKEQKFTNANGGSVQLEEDTSEFTAQPGTFGASAQDEVNVLFRVATTAENLAANPGGTAASVPRVMSAAAKLGVGAYPPEMGSAITKLKQAAINPFSSFYDIFLPAGVSHFFPEGHEARLCVAYDAAATDPYGLNIYYFNTTSNEYVLQSENKSVDTDNQRICVSLTHASVFTVLASSLPVISGAGYTGELNILNFPNPFNLKSKVVTLQNPGSAAASQTINGTMIKISVPASIGGNATIEIFSVTGERIRTIHQPVTSAAHNYFEWDGTNDSGSKVASGTYIGRMTIDGANEKFFKMAVLK